tara:strand:- start:2255 stop:2533 length:279 start_codon:yes stop_codon:yes gene_type:complete
MSIREVIKRWLLDLIQQGKIYVKSSDIETHLVKYGLEYWDVMHTPSTYSREWRKFRADKEYKNIDIHTIDKIKTRSKQTTWMIIPDYSKTGT